MPDRIIKKNAWGNKAKREVYDNVIKFKDCRKNPYQWDTEDDMDGLLEYPKPHETAPIPAEFQGVEFDADLDEELTKPQDVAGDNAAAATTISNSGILHGIPTAEDDEAEDDSIKEVDMPQNEPTELINVNAGSDSKNPKKSTMRTLLTPCLKIKTMSLIQLLC